MGIKQRTIWPQFSVGGRLLLINVLLLVALSLVALMSWRSNDAQRKAMTDLALISRAARYHQDADTQNANLRADVSEALGSASVSAMSHEAVLSSLAEDSGALERDIRSLDRLELPPDLADSFSRVRELTDAYRTQANETTKAIISDPHSGAALMPAFNTAFEALQQAMLQQTGVLAKRIIAADEAADAASLEAKRWLVITTALTGLTVCGLVAVLSSSIRRSLRRVRDVARAIAGGNLAARADASSVP